MYMQYEKSSYRRRRRGRGLVLSIKRKVEGKEMGKRENITTLQRERRYTPLREGVAARRWKATEFSPLIYSVLDIIVQLLYPTNLLIIIFPAILQLLLVLT